MSQSFVFNSETPPPVVAIDKIPFFFVGKLMGYCEEWYHSDMDSDTIIITNFQPETWLKEMSTYEKELPTFVELNWNTGRMSFSQDAWEAAEYILNLSGACWNR